jgi:two-component system chemotaxis response regulator CheB
LPYHDLIVIGASAGGLPALTVILQRLPATLPAAVLIVTHSRGDGNSLVADVLGRKSASPPPADKTEPPTEPARTMAARVQSARRKTATRTGTRPKRRP